MDICLKRSENDLHMVQPMPLHPVIFASVKFGMVYPSGTSLPRFSRTKFHKTVVVVVVVAVVHKI